MGDVFIIYRILPESPDVNIEKLINEIKRTNFGDNIEVKDIVTEPLAFGLNIIKVGILAPDEEGITDRIEEILKKIKGIGEIEIEGMSLV